MAFVALMLLRVAVGFHFFTEGTVKLRSGDFTAEYFLRSAKGPIAPMFQSMLSDEDGRVRLCLIEQPEQQGFLRFDVNPELTFALWDDFVDQAVSYYQFANRDIESQLVEQRAELAKQIQEARSKKDKAVDTESLEAERVQLERDIKRLRVQIEDAEQVLEAHQLELADWLKKSVAIVKKSWGNGKVRSNRSGIRLKDRLMDWPLVPRQTWSQSRCTAHLTRKPKQRGHQSSFRY